MAKHSRNKTFAVLCPTVNVLQLYVTGSAITLHVSMQFWPIFRDLKSHNFGTVSCNTAKICILVDKLSGYILM